MTGTDEREDPFFAFDPSVTGDRRSRAVLALGWAFGAAIATYVATARASFPGWRGVLVAFGAWVVTSAIEIRTPAEALRRRKTRAVRVAYLFGAPSFALALATASPSPASPLWMCVPVAAYLLLPTGAHRHLALVVGGALAVALPLRLAHDPSASSVIACMLGALGLGLTSRWLGRQHERQRDRLAALEAEESLRSTRRSVAATVSAAMSLHDGLSGSVLVARTRAELAERFEDVDGAVARVLAGARRTLLGETPVRLADLRRELDHLAVAAGGSVTCRVRGDVEALPLDERRDLFELAIEAVGNAVRTTREDVVLSLDVDARAVRLSCVSVHDPAARESTGGGRGLRYAVLRSSLRDGTASFEREPTRAVLQVSWPRRARTLHRYADAGHATAPGSVVSLALGALSGEWTSAIVMTSSLAAVWVLSALDGRAAELRRRTEEWDAALAARRDDPVRAQVAAHLGPPLDALEAAHEARDLAGVRSALRALSTALTEILERLETSDVHPTSRPEATSADMG